MKKEKTRWFGIPKLFPYLKGYGRLVLADMIALGFIGSAMDAVIPLFQQYAIDHFIADFYCHAAKLIIELDGAQHYDEQGLARDKERTAILSEYGVAVLRFSNTEVENDFRRVCTVIDSAVNKRMRAFAEEGGRL